MSFNNPPNRRNYIHRHNGLLGQVGCVRAYLKSLRAPSLTPEAELSLSTLFTALAAFEREVYAHRLEPDGTVATIKHAEKKGV